MTKADIVDTVAADARITKRQASAIVEIILGEIRSALQRNERVALTPFGTFVTRRRKAREGRNPKTGAAINIPERSVPAFIAGKGLKEALSGKRKKNGRS